MSGRRDIERIDIKEQNTCYDLNVYYKTHMRYCVYKDSLIQKLNTSKTCNIIFEKSCISKFDRKINQ